MRTFTAILRRTIAALCLALAPLLARAATLVEAELVCPLDGETFKTTIAVPDTPINFHLDLKPTGETVAPWPLVKCPSSGFVMYKRDFSEDELARLRPFVRSAEYRALSEAHTNYYLSARLRAHLGAPPAHLAYVLLQATWEANSRVQYEAYAAEALETFKRVLAAPVPNVKEWTNAQFVAGELERRLGRFADARRRFLSLAGHEEVKEGTFRTMLQLQLRLIEAKDTASHPIPR